MAPPRRSRDRSGGAASPKHFALVVIVTGIALGMVLPTGAFTLTDFSRGATLDVSSDDAAELGLDINASVKNCARQALVNVTNNFFPSIDVTVTLADGSVGTLYTTVNSDSGSSVTMSLASGGTGTVELDANYTGSLPTTIGFDATASGTDVSVEAARSTTLEGNCPPVGDFTMTRGTGNKLNVNASASSDQDGTISSYEWYVNDPDASGTPDATGETATLNPVRSGDTITLVVTDDDGATDLISKTAP